MPFFYLLVVDLRFMVDFCCCLAWDQSYNGYKVQRCQKTNIPLENVIANNTKFLVVYFLILLEILEHIIHSLACERNSISKGTSNIDNL